MVLFGLDLRYLMAGCLAVSLVTDIVALKDHPVFTIVPLIAGLLCRFLNGTLNDAAIALAISFILNLVRFVTRRLALYDILKGGTFVQKLPYVHLTFSIHRTLSRSKETAALPPSGMAIYHLKASSARTGEEG